jgi:hypothetical protein
VDLREVAQLTEGMCVAERDVDDAVVSEGGEGVESSRLLSSTSAGGRDEHTGVLAAESTGRPELTSGIPESLELGREVTVTGGNTEEESIDLSRSV